MPRRIQPADIAAESRFAIVVAEWNKSITARLQDGAMQAFAEHNVEAARIDIVWVPGAWEIPVAVQRLAETRRYAGVLALGAVIKGETTHDEFINQGLSYALMRVALDCRTPVLCGVLTCNTMEQAIQRAGGSVGNKGVECAEAAIRMAGLLTAIDLHG
ncbi:6,7-dimethyl-8-ribityllumazine synthase [Pirellulimonas nuda]|uniref:6,7-dimethyl-8-ribityllumazine synthase n=1 Tax=Pirellulimonas nuda TaxID=2528009 RepID=A0A518DAX3_9BACT|nr:6,7-dimethyl-8-ribityllumazine synthase [Pirellulimonas nuda]QDU88637.1 6,7-dimethyl-8-ribityllumazine synthase [Pirellulimonas nuda]